MTTLSKIFSFWSSHVIQPDSLAEFDDHESVLFMSDANTGLRGFIAIHNTNRGPAVGGTRFMAYPDSVNALRDALRLSRAMSYKCALANVPYGGGKTVLLAPPDRPKDERYFASYAKRLNTFCGGFYTGEDVGLGGEDILLLEKHSKYIIGRPDVGELPSHWAARSVFVSMRAALEAVYGTASFSGKRIAIKGLGNVGFDLATLLSQESATIVAADIDPEKTARAKASIQGLEIVDPESILSTDAHIFAPCALGGDLTPQFVETTSAKIVCGAANNQLFSDATADMLHERGILYIPDYVANAGGLINVVDELDPSGYQRERVLKRVTEVADTVRELIAASRERNVSTEAVASQIARTRIGL